jgi:hypothetical protein
MDCETIAAAVARSHALRRQNVKRHNLSSVMQTPGVVTSLKAFLVVERIWGPPAAFVPAGLKVHWRKRFVFTGHF